MSNGSGNPKSPITFAALVEKIQAGKISEEEVSRYFTIAPTTKPRFAPELAINELAVDITGIEKTARQAGPPLGYDAVQVVRGRQLAAAGAPPPDGTIVAEGDSWFNLPELNFPIQIPPTLVDVLAQKFPINNIAHWGDTLSQIAAQAEYMRFMVSGKVRFFLFSAGGNDVLGTDHLADYLRQRVSGDNDPANVPTYVLPAFYRSLDGVDVLLRSIIKNVLNASPATRILIHGYDYVIPQNQGRSLGEPLAFRGFDPLWNKEMARGILRYLLDRFSARLDRIAAEHPLSVRHVNLLGTVKENEWWDELHPGRVATKRLAGKFQREITAWSAVA
jgi:hypothetical protein